MTGNRPEMPATPRLGIASSELSALVARVGARYGIAPSDFPDLLQETRMALWEIASEAPVRAALAARIASHKAVDLIRASSRRRARDRQAALFLSTGAEDAELRHLLNARVVELPQRLHELYELRYRQGLSEREIARCLGVCRASVRWLDRCCRRYLIGIGPGPVPPQSVKRSARAGLRHS